MEGESLEQLIDKGDFLNEARESRRLLLSLCQGPNIERLVHYITTDAETEKQIGYSSASTQVVCLKKEPLISAFMLDDSLLDKLHAVLTRPAPLSRTSTSVNCTCKVLSALFEAKLGEMVAYEKKSDAFLSTLNHLDDLNIFSLVLTVFHINDTNHPESQVEQLHEWLISIKFPQAIIDKLNPALETSCNRHAAELLTEMIDPVVVASALSYELGIEPPSPPPSPLQMPLLTEETLSKLLSFLFNTTDVPPEKLAVSHKYILNVLRSLVKKQVSSQSRGASDPLEIFRYPQKEKKSEPQPNEDKDGVPILFELITKHLDKFNELLVPSEDLPKVLGFARMKIIEIMACAMQSNYPSVHSAIVSSPILDSLLQVLNLYPRSNIAHVEILSIVEAIFKQAKADDIILLLGKGKLLDMIVQANLQTENREARGFFIKISRSIENVARDPTVAEFLNGHKGWKDYADGQLTQQKMLEDKLLGGHKPSKHEVDYSEDEEPEEDEEDTPSKKIAAPAAMLRFPERNSCFHFKITDIKPFELLPMTEFDLPFSTEEQQFPYRR